MDKFDPYKSILKLEIFLIFFLVFAFLSHSYYNKPVSRKTLQTFII